MKVKLFTDNSSNGLQHKINRFIEENNLEKVIDIKFSVSYDSKNFMHIYAALLMY